MRLLAAVAAGTAAVGLMQAPVGAQVQPTEPACADAPSSSFTDVGAVGTPLREAVDCIAAYGIAQGTTATTFSPARTLNRGQLALFVHRTLQQVDDVELPASPADEFDDDDGGVWEEAINVLAAADIIDGYEDGTYRPGNGVTRGQTTKIVAGALAFAGIDLPATPPDAFTDDDASVFEEWINQLAALGIVQGTGPDTFNATAGLTRGQMAYILARTVSLLVEEELVAPFTPDTTPPDLESSSPANGAVNVSRTVRPSATFDENVGPAGATVNCDTTDVAGASATTGATVTFTPAADLPFDANCVASFAVADAAGNGTVVAVAFRTAPDLTVPALSLVSSTPANGDVDVDAEAPLSATFDAAVVGGDATVFCGGGEEQDGDTTVADQTVTFTPDEDLPGETPCVATFVAADAGGNDAFVAIGFVVGEDPAPSPVSTVPAEDDTDPVALDATLSATFDEDLDADDSTASVSCDDTDVTGTTTVTDGTISFTATGELPDEADCVVTFTAVDQAGNAAEAVTVSFTTEDVTPPALESTSPEDAAEGVDVGETISADYDELLGPTSTANLVCDDVAVAGSDSTFEDTLIFDLDDADGLPDDATCTASFDAVDVWGNQADIVTVEFTTEDLTPPTVVNDGANEGEGTFPVFFDEAVDETTAETGGSYTVTDGTTTYTVVGATLQDDGSTVELQLDQLLACADADIVLSHTVADVSANANVGTQTGYVLVDCPDIVNGGGGIVNGAGA